MALLSQHTRQILRSLSYHLRIQAPPQRLLHAKALTSPSGLHLATTYTCGEQKQERAGFLARPANPCPSKAVNAAKILQKLRGWCAQSTTGYGRLAQTGYSADTGFIRRAAQLEPIDIDSAVCMEHFHMSP